MLCFVAAVVAAAVVVVIVAGFAVVCGVDVAVVSDFFGIVLVAVKG